MDLSERGASARRHPWEIERFRAYRDILAEHGALDARRVLDVGAGDGWFSEMLVAALPHVEQVVCWDINYHDLELVTDDPRLVRTTDAPSPGFDLVLVLDVLEHIEHPRRFIDAQLAPLTAAGTHVLVAVPAHPQLFGAHDRALGHHRRYRRADLLDEVSGWIDVVDHGPLFVSLVAPRAASVALERVSKVESVEHGVGGWRGGRAVTAAVSAALRADVVAVRSVGGLGRRLPGLSSWVFGTAR
jgi:hypothetical protein